MTQTVRGTGVALITPFDSNGLIDFAALKRQINRVIAGNVDFLVPLGTTAEVPTLETEEKEAVLNCVFSTVKEGFPVWVGCGGNHTKAVARQMKEWGTRYPLTGFLSVSPYYNRPTQEGLYQHFRYLAEHSPKPILLYNVPARTGRALTPETVVRLAHDCPAIVGIKEASADLSPGLDIIHLAPKEFVVLSGDDKLALPACLVNYQGCISVLANLFPFTFRHMLFEVVIESNWPNAISHHDTLFPFFDLIFQEGNPAGIKAALSLIGVCQPDVRLPLVPASSELRHKLKVALEALSLNTLHMNQAALVSN
jgi:4-hydroxy-tetrahydrodipicolinate synthase